MNNKIYCCYSINQRNYLYDNGQKYILAALNPNSKKLFWVYLKNEKLKALFVLNGFILDDRNCYYYNFCENKDIVQINKKIDKNINIRVRNIVNEIGKKKYRDDFCIKDEFDSLMFIRLVVTIEREFGVEIDLAKMNIHNFDTIEKICKFVEVNKDGN